jgi:hypothetical protein
VADGQGLFFFLQNGNSIIQAKKVVTAINADKRIFVM